MSSENMAIGRQLESMVRGAFSGTALRLETLIWMLLKVVLIICSIGILSWITLQRKTYSVLLSPGCRGFSHRITSLCQILFCCRMKCVTSSNFFEGIQDKLSSRNHQWVEEDKESNLSRNSASYQKQATTTNTNFKSTSTTHS